MLLRPKAVVLFPASPSKIMRSGIKTFPQYFKKQKLWKYSQSTWGSDEGRARDTVGLGGKASRSGQPDDTYDDGPNPSVNLLKTSSMMDTRCTNA